MEELFDTSIYKTKLVEHAGTGQTCGKCDHAVSEESKEVEI